MYQSRSDMLSYRRFAFIFLTYLSLLGSASATAEEIAPHYFTPFSGEPKDPRCTMVPQKGPCKAIFWKYYYEHKNNTCKEFMYGGCDGVVPFDTKEECEKFCIEDGEPSFPVKKPAIYLYPTQKSSITVSLRVNGTITKTIPPYNDGWNIVANPDGKLAGDYDYLFYEADLKTVSLPNEGWIVAYGELNRWFDLHLVQLGLNTKEKQQFIEYWMNELPSAPYYKIQLLDEPFLSNNMALAITPKPDALLRLNFYFTPLQQAASIKEPRIKPFIRKGFTAVEWGGIVDGSKIKTK